MMPIFAAWLLQHVAYTRLPKQMTYEKRSIFMTGQCGLTPILRLRGHGFLVHTRYFGSAETALRLGAMRLKKPWKMHRNFNRTRPRPCSLWVIINTGCCVITGLPKARSVALAKFCRQERGGYRPLA